MTAQHAGPVPGATLPVDTPAPLGLVVTLCRELARRGIDYCHFKSTEALDRSAAGLNDLDLLVRRADAARFAELAHGLGFLRARSRGVHDVPAVVHYYAPDPGTGRLVDLHVHYQLVVGDDMTKNHRLPIENAYLAASRQEALFRVPAPEFELALLVVRLVLKHATWDATLTGQGAASASEKRELADLSRQADDVAVWSVVRETMPYLPEDLWRQCVDCAFGRTGQLRSARVAQRLERALAAQARTPTRVDVPRRIVRRAALFTRRRVLRRPPERMTPETGGAVIALVGGDGAGKSTTVAATADWLRPAFRTATIHLGRPRRSLTTAAADTAWVLTRPVRSVSVSGPAELARTDATPLGRRGEVALLRQVLTSRDRYRAYVRARRLAGRGILVVCDRFPLPQLVTMDSATAPRLDPARTGSAVARALARLERRYYARMAEPDVLVVLRVPPEVAVERRRGSEDPDFVRPRVAEVWTADWFGTRAAVIDAARSLDEVQAQVRAAVWARL